MAEENLTLVYYIENTQPYTVIDITEVSIPFYVEITDLAHDSTLIEVEDLPIPAVACYIENSKVFNITMDSSGRDGKDGLPGKDGIGIPGEDGISFSFEDLTSEQKELLLQPATTQINNLWASITSLQQLFANTVLNDWFYLDENGNVGTNYNLYSTKEISAYGIGTGTGETPGTGGATNLNDLVDVIINDLTLANNQILVYDTTVEGGKWVNKTIDAFAPTSHTHGNITNLGAIGVDANLPIITGTNGVLITSSINDFKALLGLNDLYLSLTGGTMSNTNLVTNLNADLLDGLEGTYYTEYTDTAISNIQVGGRNLVRNSLVNETSSEYGFADRMVDLTEGQQYTFSFKGSASAGSTLRVFLFSPDYSMEISPYIETNSTTEFIGKTTFTSPVTATGCHCRAYAIGGSVTLNWYKLEKGNKATDWTPAPEDVDTKIALKLDKIVFDDLFEKVNLGGGVYAIKAKYDFYSIGEVSAYGLGSGSTSGATVLDDLNDVVIGGIGGNPLATNNILQYNGSKWVNVPSIDLSDEYVTLSSFNTHVNNTSIHHTHTNKTDLDGITSTLISNWNTAFGWGNHALAGYLTSFTETDPTVGNHIKAITPTNIYNWNATLTYAHIHDNKTIIDQLSQSNLDVLSKLSLVNGKLQISVDTYSTGELSAYGAGEGGSGSSYSRLDTWASYDATKADWVLSALLGNDLNTRVIALEGGSTTSISTTGTGNAITSVTKSGAALTFTKGATFIVEGDSRLTDARKNPNALIFTGYSTATYDGSAAISVPIPTKVSQLTNDSSFLTVITKAQVETVLTGNITSHTHSQYLTGNQTIFVTGDATGSGTTSIALTLANSGVTAGTYRSVAVDAKGRVTAGSNPTTLSDYGITDAYTKSQVDSSVNTKVSKSGDTMTGNLTMGVTTDIITNFKTWTKDSSKSLKLFLDKFDIDAAGNLVVKTNLYSTGEVTAYSSGTGVSGLKLMGDMDANTKSIVNLASITNSQSTISLTSGSIGFHVLNSNVVTITDDGLYSSVGIEASALTSSAGVYGTSFNFGKYIFKEDASGNLGIYKTVSGVETKLATILSTRTNSNL